MCLEITLCKYETNRILKLLSPDPQGQIKKNSLAIFYILVYMTLLVLGILLQPIVGMLIKVMQTHLENLKILMKQCLFSLLRCVLGQLTKIVQK